MTKRTSKRSRWLAAGAGAVLALWMAGCEDDRFDHDPPAGQGAVIVDNYTGDKVRVYIDGEERESLKAGKHRAYDLEPGICRVVLDGDEAWRSWTGDVDVLDGRLTVLEVTTAAWAPGSYDVRVYFD